MKHTTYAHLYAQQQTDEEDEQQTQEAKRNKKRRCCNNSCCSRRDRMLGTLTLCCLRPASPDLQPEVPNVDLERRGVLFGDEIEQR